MKPTIATVILNEYADALTAKGITPSATATRKAALKKALNYFKNRKELDETIKNQPKFGKFIVQVRNDFPKKEADKIRNALVKYAELILGLSIASDPAEVKKALLSYADAVAAFDRFGEFNTDNIVGEYGEDYVCKKFKLDRSFTNSKDYDAVFEENGVIKTVQIKARWARTSQELNGTNVFGDIKPNKIDYFVGVIFDSRFDEAVLIVMDQAMMQDYFTVNTRKRKIVIYNPSFDFDRFCLKALNKKKVR
ncbi:MAG: hypothetical protein K6E59_01140 [Bacilli bacterium]|nr:hypothetical protein [Bacilli bacterium]